MSSPKTSWISWFCGLKGNEFFCEVDKDYIHDEVNLTGLNKQLSNISDYRQTLDTILDVDYDDDDEIFDIQTYPISEFMADMYPIQDDYREVNQDSTEVYGLIHARYILTDRGIAQMIEKYQAGDFGHCPRVYCEDQPMLPIGLSDVPGEAMVQSYCPKCMEVYKPVRSKHHSTDGAYFGTRFPHMLFMVHPEYRPKKPPVFFTPRLYGFKIHPSARQLQ